MTEGIIAVLGGVVLIVAILSDAVATLVVTQGDAGLWRPTRIFYATTWRAVRALAARVPDRLGAFVLNVYPALSLLALLVLWLVGLLVGWSLVYWGADTHVAGAHDWGGFVYYAGTSLVTPAFGSARGAFRMITLLETLTGVVTIALVISYLPALYAAYSRRESRLLTLDDPRGGRITPVHVIAVNAPGGDLELLYRSFAEWEQWIADLLESHVSYPMLALFRSQHEGQSWVTALGVVTDTAALASACIEGARDREPYFVYRRGRRAVLEISSRLHVPSRDQTHVARRGELRGGVEHARRCRPPAPGQGDGVGRPPGAPLLLRARAREPDRLPRGSARFLGPLGGGHGGRGGGAGRGRRRAAPAHGG